MHQEAKTVDEQVQEYAALRCNFPGKKQRCGQVVREGVFLRCRHLFCREHARQWFAQSEECPICRDGAAKRRDVGRADDRERLRLLQELLVTSNPLEVQEAASMAVEIWEGQKAEEYNRDMVREQEISARVSQLNRTIRKRLSEAESSVRSRTAEAEDLRRRVKEAEQKLLRERDSATKLSSRLSQLQHTCKLSLSEAAGLTPSRKRLRTFLSQ
ncbi:unnamed protein product, partial [Effrenium voratum]